MVEQHPQLHPKMHYVSHVAVIKVYVAVSRHVTVFPDFLARTGLWQLSVGRWTLCKCAVIYINMPPVAHCLGGGVILV